MIASRRAAARRRPAVEHAKRLPMRNIVLPLLAALFVVTGAGAENLPSRYGAVVTAPAKAGSFEVSLEGRPLAVIAAESLSLTRVTPKGAREYVVIEKWLPGLHCHTEYQVLTIHPDRRTRLSPSFGKCMELHEAAYLAQGVKVRLRSPVAAGGKRQDAVYLWAHGKLSRP